MFDLAPIDIPDLTGQTILVTGAGRGIGQALTRLLVEHGARVFAGHQSEPIDAEPREATHLRLDVTRQSDVDAAIARIREASGRLDGLINNAGVISPIGRVAELDSDSLNTAFEVNVIGVHRLTRAALPLLEASGGVVVNAGTGAATTPMEGWTAYCTSKAAARMLTQIFAHELGDRGVRFFFLGIPPTDTAMQAEIRTAGLNPISRIAKGDLVDPVVPASVIAWLCGREGRATEDILLDVRDERFTRMMLSEKNENPSDVSS